MKLIEKVIIGILILGVIATAIVVPIVLVHKHKQKQKIKNIIASQIVSLFPKSTKSQQSSAVNCIINESIKRFGKDKFDDLALQKGAPATLRETMTEENIMKACILKAGLLS